MTTVLLDKTKSYFVAHDMSLVGARRCLMTISTTIAIRNANVIILLFSQNVRHFLLIQIIVARTESHLGPKCAFECIDWRVVDTEEAPR